MGNINSGRLSRLRVIKSALARYVGDGLEPVLRPAERASRRLVREELPGARLCAEKAVGDLELQSSFGVTTRLRRGQRRFARSPARKPPR
jgi:hypothetical protein